MNLIFLNTSELSKTLQTVEIGTPIVITLSLDQTLTHELTIDNTLTDLEIMRYLSGNAEKFFGRHGSELCVDYKKMATNTDAKNKLIVFAAHRAVINDIRAICSQQKKLLQKIQPNNEPNINFLPWRESASFKKKKNIIYRCILYAGIFCLVSFIFHFILIKNTTHLQSRIKKVEYHIGRIHLQHSQQNKHLLSKLNTLHAEKKFAVNSNHILENIFLVIANQLPSEMVLTAVIYDGKKIMIAGLATQLSDIHQYNVLLQKKLSPIQFNLTQIQVDSTNSKIIHFTIRAIL